jgi:hypothetical protein
MGERGSRPRGGGAGLGNVTNETSSVANGGAFRAEADDNARGIKEPEVVSVAVNYGPFFAI